MQNVNLVLKAGVPQRVPVAGNVLMVLSADQGNGLTLDFSSGNAIGATLANMGPGARIAPQGGFTGVTVTAAEDGNVSMVITNGDIDVQLSQMAATVANGDAAAIPVRTPAGTRLAVDIGGGTVNVTAANVGINNTAANPVPVSLVSEPGAPVAVNGTVNIGNTAGSPVPVSIVNEPGAPFTVTPTQGATVAEVAPVAVAGAVGALLAAGVRRAFRVRNAGAGLLAIGGNAALTLAQAVIVLNPGDVWEEVLIPQAAWYAISDTGTTAAVEVIA